MSALREKPLKCLKMKRGAYGEDFLVALTRRAPAALPQLARQRPAPHSTHSLSSKMYRGVSFLGRRCCLKDGVGARSAAGGVLLLGGVLRDPAAPPLDIVGGAQQALPDVLTHRRAALGRDQLELHGAAET